MTGWIGFTGNVIDCTLLSHAFLAVGRTVRLSWRECFVEKGDLSLNQVPTVNLKESYWNATAEDKEHCVNTE